MAGVNITPDNAVTVAGRSGLGIDAQRATVTCFADAEGMTIIAEYVEAE